MNKIFITFFLSFFLALQSWGACSTAYQTAFINEVNTKDNFIEIYAPATVPNGDYNVTACTSTTNCTTITYTIDGSTSWYWKNFSLINNRSEFDITLYDPNGNVADYIRIGNPPATFKTDYLSCPSIASAINSSSHTYTRTNSGQRDFYRSYDGSSTWQETTWNNDTKGATNGGTPPPPVPVYCTSLQYSLYHNFNSSLIPPYRLQTRIAQQNFDLNVTVSCSTTGTIPSKTITAIYLLNSSDPCTAIPASSSQLLWSGSKDINDTITTVTISPLYSSKAYSNAKLMLKTDTGELYCSSDTLAIRPSSYTISSPSSPIKATAFGLNVSALNSGGGYNGTTNASTALQTPNPACPVNTFLTSNSGAVEPLSLTFINDTNVSQLKATDVGAVYLNVKDVSWTTVDQSNDCVLGSNSNVANSEGKFGCNIESNISLLIVPNNFDVNSTLTNANGGFFTYLSNDLNMSAQLALSITAKNGEGNTTRNYDKGCYAKSTTLTLPHTLVPDPLTKIFYRETLSASEGNVSKSSDITLSLLNTVFTQGVAPLVLSFNFDRDRAKPLSPFYFNFTAPTVSDADLVTNGGGINTMTGTSTFLYGRARAYDIATNVSPVSIPVEFEVYSAVPTGYVSAMPQNVLKWYRNLNHTAAVQGNVLRGGFSAGTTSSALNVSAPPQNGIQIMTLTSAADQTVHLDITPWLWYSPGYNYDYTGGCTQHPCFSYDYTNAAAGVSGVSSGTFQGSDFQMAPAQNITNKGVKVFR